MRAVFFRMLHVFDKLQNQNMVHGNFTKSD